MSRNVPSLVALPRRLFLALMALVLAVIPVPAPGPGGTASANAAGPPGVEHLDGFPLVGEFVTASQTMNHVVLTWDEILDPRFVPDGSDFTITINTVDHPADGVELLFSGMASESTGFGDDGVSFMRLDLPPDVAVAAGDSVQLDYRPGATPVRDLALNAAPEFLNVEATIAEFGTFDHLVSVVDSYHGANKVVVVLTEPVEPASLPAAASRFTVEVDTVDVPVVSVVADLYPEIGLAFLELTLETPVTEPSAPVIINYASEDGTLVSRYSGQALGDIVDASAVVILATNAKAATLDLGGSLSTASGTGPTPGDPLETTVTAAAPGDASITEGSVDFPSPPGYGFFGHQVVVELPDAPSPTTPNVLRFGIDASVVPPGQNETTVQVFRDGVLVPDCTDPGAGVAEPSPCVSERTPLDGGDIGLTVLTVQASTWNLGIALPFAFEGFFAPIDDGVPNIVNAGRAIPVKFSLGGDRGLDIFADGSPFVQSVACGDLEDGDLIEETVAAGQSGLEYDAGTDTYTYVWKTNRAWADTCRRLVLEFADGTVATALFSFPR